MAITTAFDHHTVGFFVITFSKKNLVDGVMSVLFLDICWPDCKPEGPLFLAEFVCVSLTGTSALQH